MDFHPVANIFPLMNEDELIELANDIAEHGQIDPIIIHENKILDGRNRYLACELASVEPDYDDYTGDENEIVSYVISLNLKRRHLSESQRAMVAANIANLPHGGAVYRGANWPIESVSTQDAADMLNVGERSVKRARQVKESGAPELIEAVTTGKASVSAAADIVDLPKEQQAELVARGEDEILKAAKEIRHAKSEKRREELKQQRQDALKITPPAGQYRTIVIDPPWDIQKVQRDVRPNQFEFDYPTMTHEDISKFPVPELACDECHLYLWTTQKHLRGSFVILCDWGFTHIFTMVWHKPGGFQPHGLPQYNCEFVLFGRMGDLPFLDTKAFNTCFNAPRKEHSRKPDEFYDLVRRVSPGPHIDVFSREPREGFDQYGDETNKYAG